MCILSVVQGIQCCVPAAIPPPPLPTTVRIPSPTNGYRRLVHRLILQTYTGINGPGRRLGEREHRANVDEPVPSAEDELENEKGLVSLSRPQVLSGSVGRGLANLKPWASVSRQALAQQGQEQGHERPKQGGRDAPPLGELPEGQQPEQGDNAGDRHTK